MNQYEVKAGLAEIDAFTVCGISVVTENARAAEDINALWEQFFKESVGQRVPDKVDDIIYAVYSDYEGDHEAPYRVTIGYRTSNKDPHPHPLPQRKGDNSATSSDLHYVKCKEGEYAVMSAAGEQPKALIETWKAIWSSDLERSFQTDFELYGPRFFEDGVHEVLVHVGVKR